MTDVELKNNWLYCILLFLQPVLVNSIRAMAEGNAMTEKLVMGRVLVKNRFLDWTVDVARMLLIAVSFEE